MIHPGDVVAPEEAAWDDLLMIHTPAYLSALREGTLTAAEQRRMGLPWSTGLVHRSRLAVQGTVNATRMALQDGIAANLAGGTHHAFPDHGEGFCVLNDVAVAIRVLQRSQQMRRALVVDLDVHQGNGTAAAFADDPAVYTFSMHGEKNYPWHKEQSSRDVGLSDHASDAEYLSTLDRHLPEVFAEARPDLVFYLAGVDVLAGDRFGRLSLAPHGLQARDRYVLETAHARSVRWLSSCRAATPIPPASPPSITPSFTAKRIAFSHNIRQKANGAHSVRPAGKRFFRLLPVPAPAYAIGIPSEAG